MADPPPREKKVFSIFERPKPRGPARRPEDSPPPRDSEPVVVAAAQHASTPAPTSRRRPNEPTRQARDARRHEVERTDSRESACTTISIVSSDEDNDQPAAAQSLARRSNDLGKNAARTRGKAARRISIETTDDEDADDCIVVARSTLDRDGANKAKKGKGPSSSSSSSKRKPRGGGRAVPELESIDLTESPPRKPASSSSSSSSFAPLSSLYRQERERRRIHSEGLEPRWPTAEEHGHHFSQSTRARLDQPNARYPGSSVRSSGDEEDSKGKGREVDTDDEFSTRCFRTSLANSDRFASSSRRAPTVVVELSDVPVASTSSLVPAHPQHPLLERLASDIRADVTTSRDRESRTELWTTKYGPKKAREVLGDVSGTSALLLREWLTELKVAGGAEDEHSNKRRRPVNRGIDKRKKKKKRRKDGLDDFLASSSGEDDDDYDEAIAFDSSIFDDDDGEEGTDDAGRGQGRPPNSSVVFPRLTNLILLVGPSGSGKTVAVHAVAHELGYEVFEVNAGMGKRRAKDLESEVGDVGRNHIVRASPRKSGAKDFFAGFKVNPTTTTTKGKGKAPGHGQGGGGGDNGAGLKGPAQSLILIEEVDVLYGGEEDFWTGVKALAEESRRPIVLTCNETSLVPLDQLGLQKVHLATPSSDEPLDHLAFAPPSTDLVGPYLEMIAFAEGHIVPSAHTRRLYERSRGVRDVAADDDDDEQEDREGRAWWTLCRNAKGVRPLPHPFSSDGTKEKDLRQAVMQLQFELQRDGRAGRTDGADPGEPPRGYKRWIVGGLEGTTLATGTDDGSKDARDWLSDAVSSSDALSFADAHVARRIEMRIEDLDHDVCTNPSDLEAGLPVLSPKPPRADSSQFASSGREPEMVDAIENTAYTMNPRAVRYPISLDESIESRKLSLVLLVDYLQSLALLSNQFYYDPISETYHAATPFLPHPTLVVDHLPLYQHLTAFDDAREQIAEATGHDVDATTSGGTAARGAGVRRSTRVTAGGGDGAGPRGGSKPRFKIARRIEWRAREDAEFVRASRLG